MSLDVPNDDKVLDGTEEDDLQLLQPDIKLTHYVTCDNVIELCAVQTVDLILAEQQIQA
jgi:hypothetical protein